MKFIISFFVFVSLLSCNNDDDSQVNCTEIYVSGLDVTVKNVLTNEIITEGIIVIAVDGTYSEELTNEPDFDNFVGAGERPGNYIITVTGEGYQTFVSETIIVSGDVCHVFTELLEFSLVTN